MALQDEAIDADEWIWPYAVARADVADATPIQFFERIQSARELQRELERQYPDIPFSIFVRGDQAYYGCPAAHEQTH